MSIRVYYAFSCLHKWCLIRRCHHHDEPVKEPDPMRCPFCREVNRESAKYCAGCGRPFMRNFDWVKR